MKSKTKVVEKINERKSWFFEKIKALAALTKKRRCKLPITGVKGGTLLGPPKTSKG